MPTTPSLTFSNRGVVPLKNPEGAHLDVVNLKPSTTFAAGQVLGELVGADEVQRITITGSPTGGSFTLTFDGQTTTPIAHNASAAAVVAALEALANIGDEDLAATGGPLPGAAIELTYQNALGRQNVPQLTADGSGLTGGTSPAVAVTTLVAGSAGSPGVYAPYDPDNTDGSQWPTHILKYPCATDAGGNVTVGDGPAGTSEFGQASKGAPAYRSGLFATADLVGLDMNAVARLGRLVQGTVANGRLSVSGN